MFQGLGLRPGLIDGAISISAVQVCSWLMSCFTVFTYFVLKSTQLCKSCLVDEKLIHCWLNYHFNFLVELLT